MHWSQSEKQKLDFTQIESFCLVVLRRRIDLVLGEHSNHSINHVPLNERHVSDFLPIIMQISLFRSN